VPTVVIPSGTVPAAGSTRLAIRARLAMELGFYVPATVQAAAGGDPTRIVLSEELRDDESRPDALVVGGLGRPGPWIYVRTGAQAGTQRRVLDDPAAGYQGQLGALVVSRPFPTPLEAGVVVEVTHPLPSSRYLGVSGLNQAIDAALGLIWVSVRLGFDGNGTDRYDTAPFSNLLEEQQTSGLYVTSGLSDRTTARRYPYRERLLSDGPSMALVTPRTFGSSETFELGAVVRADRIVHDGTNWTTIPLGLPGGLAGDMWRTIAPPQWVHAFAMAKALQQLEKMVRAAGAGSPRDLAPALDDVSNRRRQWELTAAQIKLCQFPERPQLPSDAMLESPTDAVYH
jgi:hypothetical protein